VPITALTPPRTGMPPVNTSGYIANNMASLCHTVSPLMINCYACYSCNSYRRRALQTGVSVGMSRAGGGGFGCQSVMADGCDTKSSRLCF